MPLDVAKLLFDLILVLFCGSMMSFLVVFVLHFLLPKPILNTYFKSPYFSPAEVNTFTGFPLAYMRTFMFLRILAFPASGKKRGLTEVHKKAPRWMCRLAKWVLVLFVSTNSLLLLLLLFFFLFT